jgi:aryl-alcohol dehydrogenase-like predicted oxidoreductase
MQMFTRQLGRTDLFVSALCFGGNVFGWTVDEHGSFVVLDAYFEGGGNFIDTADVYGQGASESILGRWMRSCKNRDRIILATKLGFPIGNDPKACVLSGHYILQAVESSLKRLQTDSIDLYQAHGDDPATPLTETMATFDELVQQGKVRSVGASIYSAQRLREALSVCDQHGYVRYSCLQPLYNLVNRVQYEGGT